VIFHPIPRTARPAPCEQQSLQGGYQTGARGKTRTSGAEVTIATGRPKVGDENPHLPVK
jgi:hypothetical protein